MVSAIRDSSLDYRTYWLQGGQYYSRRGLEGVSPGCSLPQDKLLQIPEPDRKILVEEANADPVFCRKVADCMATKSDWAHLISRSAKEAIANEMDPSRFKNRVGTWRKLRERANLIVNEVSKAMAEGKVPRGARAVSGLGGLGQWDILAGLIGSIGTAAVNVYGAGVQNRAQIDAQRDQANAAIALAQAQMDAANAASAMTTAANPVSSAISAVTSATVAGIPVLALAIPAIGLIIYFATKK